MNNAKLSRLIGSVAAAALCALLANSPAQAGLILSLNPGTTNAASPSTNQFFDVVLFNNTPSVGIAGFSFGLNVSSSNLVFTGATTASPGYVFAGDSLFGPDIRTSADGQSVLASDLTASGNNVSLAANTTYTLGRVFFSILAGTPAGLIPVIFDAQATSLSDSQGGAVAIGTIQNGNVNIPASTAVPEPGTFALVLGIVPALAILRKRFQP